MSLKLNRLRLYPRVAAILGLSLVIILAGVTAYLLEKTRNSELKAELLGRALHATHRIERQLSTPWRWKLQTAATFCSRIPTRLVPLATPGGRPRNIRMGRVRKEPPPAITLSTPAISPAAKSSR